MKKLVNSLGLLVAVAALSTLSACDLYFGHSNGGNWSYCGADGQYNCTDTGNGQSSCTWVSPTCSSSSGSGGSSTTPSGGSGSGSGYECTTNTQCAAGCYCNNGVCTEGGFCTTNADCGTGYFCDTNRSSCEPGCTANTDCPQGQYCDSSTNQCTASCTCTTDADAVSQGYGWCDNGTCAPGTDPNGSCGGAVTCATAMPTCPSGQVPTISNGCWTGSCEAYASCDVAPSCPQINDETDCLSRTTDCLATYTGIDCTKADGTACKSGDTGCTCASFQFASCTTK